ncbi:amidohydrolase family protein [Flavobacteriaceae bacterium GSB9]|nr:amidohydrolase family protein [Flavobacteriaceae bacterium GSB9]
MKRAIIYLIPILLMSCNEPTTENTSADMLIKNITLIDGTGNSERYNQNIYIREGRIVKIDTLRNYSVADTVVDGSGKYMIPGLFDNHFHLYRDSVDHRRMLKQLIHFGVTNVFIPGGSQAPYPNLLLIDSLEISNQITSPKIWYTSPYVTIEGAHPMKTAPQTKWVDGENVYILKDGSAIPEIIRDAKANGAIGIKLEIENGPAPPFIERIDTVLIRKIAKEAHANNLMLVSHISDMEEVRLSVAHGVDAMMHFAGPIDLENDLDLIMQIKEKNISWVTTSNMLNFVNYALHPELLDTEVWDVFDIEREELKANQEQAKQMAVGMIKKWFNMEIEEWENRINPGLFDINKLDSLGVNIVLGTDPGSVTAYNITGLNVHEEMQNYQKGGMNPLRIIKCATLNAATMLGVQEDYGTLEAGKHANMVILSENPLEDISNTLSIDVVIKNGEIQERITNANNVYK